MKQEARDRIMSTPLAVDVRGNSVRVVVAADRYTVAQVSEGMSDREDYARLFAAAPELLAVAEQHAKTIAYYVGVDRSNGDDEGARLKTMSLYLVNETIAKAKGGTDGAGR